MLGTGQQHWSTVHAADLADFFRRVLEDDSARGRYIIGNGLNPTVADLTEARRRSRSSRSGARFRRRGSGAPGDYFAEVLLLDQGTSPAKARDQLGWSPIHPGLVDELRDGRHRRVPAR